jgi:hypothetical protein
MKQAHVTIHDSRTVSHRVPVVLDLDDVPDFGRSPVRWTPMTLEEPDDSLRARLARPLRVVARLALPVLLLAILLGAAFLYSDALLLLPGAPRLVQNSMLTLSDLVLPMAWTLIHLTNRRFGASYAFGQLLAGMAILIGIGLVNPHDVNDWVVTTPALSWRALLAFAAAFLMANFIAIIFFDAARGPRWWSAPLAASFAASLVFSAVYYPAAFAWADEIAWTDSALVHFAVFFGESVILLGAYWLLRPASQPLHGMNG